MAATAAQKTMYFGDRFEMILTFDQAFVHIHFKLPQQYFFALSYLGSSNYYSNCDTALWYKNGKIS
jgi:hypothetical protein